MWVRAYFSLIALRNCFCTEVKIGSIKTFSEFACPQKTISTFHRAPSGVFPFPLVSVQLCRVLLKSYRFVKCLECWKKNQTSGLFIVWREMFIQTYFFSPPTLMKFFKQAINNKSFASNRGEKCKPDDDEPPSSYIRAFCVVVESWNHTEIYFFVVAGRRKSLDCFLSLQKRRNGKRKFCNFSFVERCCKQHWFQKCLWAVFWRWKLRWKFPSQLPFNNSTISIKALFPFHFIIYTKMNFNRIYKWLGRNFKTTFDWKRRWQAKV